MKLSEYVAETIKEIADAVEKAQENIHEDHFHVTICPEIMETPSHSSLSKSTQYGLTTIITFDVSVEVGSENKTKAGFGGDITVVSASLNAGFWKRFKNSNKEYNKVSFQIPIAFMNKKLTAQPAE